MKKLLTLLMLCPILLWASPKDTTQSTTKKIYITQKIDPGQSINFDGKIDDSVWNSVGWGSDFTVQQPNNGDVPQRSTQFKKLYDDSYLYLAYRCHHEEPEEIENRLSRRDRFPGDWVEINIDSYHDLRTAFSFTASVSGVRGDEFITGDGNNWDTNWNPVWGTRTNIDEQGWTAEVKIPLSQLRYGGDEEQVWGFNIMRRDFRADEKSTWQHIPQNSSGWVSQFGELHGIKNIKPKRQIEIQPYVLAKAETFEKQEGNPFRDGSNTSASIGLDGKVGLTSDITLDFTINPDFGQVEADPSQLNIDGFQIFFQEQRPFFVENSNLFEFRLTEADAGGPFGIDNLFYSRRIGQRPRGSHDIADGSFSDSPNFTSILGAAKVSGKTKNGFSIGLLESITAEEHIKIQSANGQKSTKVAEPFTNYFVGRAAQDFNEGATVLSGTLTSVTRNLDGTGLEDQYHSDALSGGLSLLHTWKNREYQIRANLAFSNVKGTAARIEETQSSFEHYFQRPDADYIELDPTLTSLGGNAGTLTFANYWGKDNVGYQTGVTWRSTGFEINDIGFLNSADVINHFTWVGWRAPKPFGIIRRLQINANEYSKWTSNGDHLSMAYNVNGFTSFTNTWGLNLGINYETKDLLTKALFGGPTLRGTNGYFNWIGVNSDNRKKITYRVFYGNYRGVGTDKGALRIHNLNFGVSAQPSNALSISLSPRYFHQNRAIQNVSSTTFNGQDRYITGRVNQKTISMSLRLNYSLSPNMSIQYWGQPFISKGNYTEFKYITDPLAKNYQDRFNLYANDMITQSEGNGTYYVDEDGNGSTDYSFDNPDFNFLQFRSNLVMRWEYKPGSEFFLVWTQSTSNSADPNKPIFDSLSEDLFTKKIDNIFLMKFTYRFINS